MPWFTGWTFTSSLHGRHDLRRAREPWTVVSGVLHFMRAIFLVVVRSRGVIGRPRATSGAIPTAGRSVDGPDGRKTNLRWAGRG